MMFQTDKCRCYNGPSTYDFWTGGTVFSDNSNAENGGVGS